jgi:hypothetical protein
VQTEENIDNSDAQDMDEAPILLKASAEQEVQAVEPIIPAALQQDIPSDFNLPKPPEQIGNENHPIMVRAIEDDDLTSFEKKTVRIGKWGVGVAAASLLAAIVAGMGVWLQFGEMSKQTGILAAAFEKQKQDSVENAKTTAKQLKILQDQVVAAQGSAGAIQKQSRTAERAWIAISWPDSKIVVTENQPITYKVRFLNTGNTAGQNVLVEAVVELVKNGSAPTFDYSWDHIRSNIGSLPKGEDLQLTARRLEHQRSPYDGTPLPLVVSHIEFQDYIAGRYYVAVYAKAEYRDIFGVRHTSKRCTWAGEFGPDAEHRTFSARQCAEYSSEDGN